ncbi:Na+/H+ antiporter subunit E [Roseicella aquatilis]|uniref:Sodium:proton antiporter n=1 Tax=Roseicella aquatilis TaxID=2527868 RepID=A0A4R4DUP1_9PROT|nr:Na+/H+ antiporter subunit E [Roseicella aquatilis]TCZ64834.1 sodium:proton antiporter [Roseicella aquatilis]
MAGVGRFAAFLGLWLVLSGSDPAGLVVGLAAAALAARISLRLLPPAGGAVRPGAVLRLGLLLLRDSLAAGLDIARRALDPRLPIRPGLVPVPLRLSSGRDAFRLVASLQPGTLPVGMNAEGRLLVHALDTRLPVAAEAGRTEALVAAALGRDAPHG